MHADEHGRRLRACSSARICGVRERNAMDEIEPLSHEITTTRVLELLDGLDWPRARVADVGAGNGYFSQALGETLRARGLDAGAHIAACDAVPEEFCYAP